MCACASNIGTRKIFFEFLKPLHILHSLHIMGKQNSQEQETPSCLKNDITFDFTVVFLLQNAQLVLFVPKQTDGDSQRILLEDA